MNFKSYAADIIRKISALMLVVITALCVFSGCDDGKKPVGLIPAYIGSEVTTTDHEFKNEDFYVLASYGDGTDEEVKNFEIKSVKLESGYYKVRLSYRGAENTCYVQCHVNVFPSDETAG